MGNYKSPLICDVPTLNACYKFLNDKNVAIYNQDYASLLDMIPDNSLYILILHISLYLRPLTLPHISLTNSKKLSSLDY